MPHNEVATAIPSKSGIWRVGRRKPVYTDQLLERVDDANPRGGNRFDSFTADYETTYFGTSREVCLAETLARFRPKADLTELVTEEWGGNGWMTPGSVPQDWRVRHVLTRNVVESPSSRHFGCVGVF
ncbi:MAG: RES domain-containing protein [Acidimicrobiales bacterium]